MANDARLSLIHFNAQSAFFFIDGIVSIALNIYDPKLFITVEIVVIGFIYCVGAVSLEYVLEQAVSEGH